MKFNIEILKIAISQEIRYSIPILINASINKPTKNIDKP